MEAQNNMVKMWVKLYLDINMKVSKRSRWEHGDNNVEIEHINEIYKMDTGIGYEHTELQYARAQW